MVGNRQDWLVRRPRFGVAEEVADQLRRRLLSGQVADGDVLPKQEELVAIYGVSKVAIREALRILETEGLVEVRRGNVGGAVVHLPSPDAASYMLGLVLQGRHVSFAEVRIALLHLEPVCAGLCASRSDRKRTVIPTLRSSQRSLRRAIQRNDSPGIVAAIRDFHEALVTCCGNETLIVVVGALEWIWTTHASASGEQARSGGNAQDPERRESTWESHEEIIAFIEHGDVDQTTKAVRAHLESAGLHKTPLSPDFPVDAAAIRDRLFQRRQAESGPSAADAPLS